MPAEDAHRVVCHLDELLERAGMTLADLARAVGVTVVNLSVLKNDRARAVRFSTLTAICDVLGCQPGDVFGVVPAHAPEPFPALSDQRLDPWATPLDASPGSGREGA